MSLIINSLPIRAMTRLLAEMQTSIFYTAMPIFEADVVRFGLFVLIQRQSLAGRAISNAGLAASLGLPVETCRRHTAKLIEMGFVEKAKAGITANNAKDDDQLGLLTRLAHDCLVRFIADFARFDPLPSSIKPTPAYDWRAGVQIVSDLMLAVASSNRGAHRDWMDLVLFSAILCANDRRITGDQDLAWHYRSIEPAPPAELRCPVTVAVLSRTLSIPSSTVQRRLAFQKGKTIDLVGGGFVVAKVWFESEDAVQTSIQSYANVRRLLGALARNGFPFDDVESAYIDGRPEPVPFL